jgi:hypothetical protein
LKNLKIIDDRSIDEKKYRADCHYGLAAIIGCTVIVCTIVERARIVAAPDPQPGADRNAVGA